MNNSPRSAAPHMQLLKIPCNSKHRLNNDNVGRIHVSQCHKSNESLWKESISKFLSGRYVLICGYSPKFHPIWRYSYSHLNMNVVAFEDLCRLPRRCTSSQARLLIAGVRVVDHGVGEGTGGLDQQHMNITKFFVLKTY